MINRQWCTTILLSASLTALVACGGGSPDSYDATGLSSGSVSAGFIPDAAAAEPQIGAASPTPLADDFEAIRFLHRATFGPRSDDIAPLRASGYELWLQQQFSLPPTFMLPLTIDRAEPRWSEHVNSWLKLTVNAPDQLRQRVAFALSQLLVVSDQGELDEQPAALANYYDILIANAFGNYRDLLQQVTLSPVMGDYLSMKGNQKPNPEENIRPDENYAREVLQLFSIGTVQLNIDGTVVTDDSGARIPTYDQAVVEGFAHVFTGWHFNEVDHWMWPENPDWFSPMQAYEQYHDSAEKKLLNGAVLPAGQSAEKDLNDALDIIFQHPNVAPFVAKHLITQLVTSNPSPAYVERVAKVFENDGSGDENTSRGNLAAVVAALLTDAEAIDGRSQQTQTFGKLREPLVRLVALWRAFDGNPDHPDFEYGWIDNELAQAPLRSPTVFNFFSPDFSQSGEIRELGLKSPEYQIYHEGSIASITSMLLAHSVWINKQGGAPLSDAPIDLANLMAHDDNRDNQLRLVAHLTLGQPASSALLNQANFLLDERFWAEPESRAAELLFLFTSSPEAAIQR